MDTEKVIEEYATGKSINQLSKEFNTYPAKIFRLLQKAGCEIRNKSDAQKNALKSGISIHPTEGKKRPPSTKNKISEKNAKVWENKTDEEREKFKQNAKANWSKKSADERIAMGKKAGAALREASIHGSRAEHFVREKLEESGYKVDVHRTDIGGNYEVDLYLPKHQVAIEIDGPQHFLPVFGAARLEKNIKYDTVKNGILLSKGIKIIRVKYIKKHSSQKILRDLWNNIDKELQSIISKKNTTNLIEIEV
jgi:very-short-patch-repair endonuclease